MNLCIEANPKIYKSEYSMTTNEVINVVRKIKKTHILVNLDLGAMIYGRENIKKIIEENIDLIGHVQISAPKLVNLTKYKKNITILLKTLKKYSFSKTISLELLMKNKNNISNLDKNIKIIKGCLV